MTFDVELKPIIEGGLTPVVPDVQEVHRVVEIDLAPFAPFSGDACCTGVIKIVAGQSYPAGQFQWKVERDITGQDVTLLLQGKTFAGSASGMIATVPLTSAQTQSLEKTTHERSEFRLKAGDTVTVGKAEII